MKCPRDDGELKPEIQAGMEVDRCGACAGVWLDTGEGEILTRPGDDDLPPGVIAEVHALGHSEPNPDDSPSLRCPRCEKAMERERYAESQIEIDRCACGVWLDAGELEKITAYRIKVLETLRERHGDEEDHDLAFSAHSLERAFARIYFDLGKLPKGPRGG